MRTLTLAALALLTSGSALAADHELSLELGTLSANDHDWNWYTDSNANLPSWGLRGAYAFHQNLSAVVGYHHVRRGASLWQEEEGSAGNTWFLGNEITVGVHADTGSMSRVFAPYVNLQALVFTGSLHFDGDIEDDENPDEISESAMSLGALPVAGLEVRLPMNHSSYTAAVFAEGGWAVMGPMQYETLGDQAIGGFVFRTGAGVRF
ncbi:MAG: hypothetical protein JXX28_08890 [Deltaproteobacteria bacterium]|nr:hypothetical protein [Deltaproteobacteria bacterium]